MFSIVLGLLMFGLTMVVILQAGKAAPDGLFLLFISLLAFAALIIAVGIKEIVENAIRKNILPEYLIDEK